MKGATIHINEKTFEVKVVCDPGFGFLPSEHTIAIKKYAELAKEKLGEFLDKEHNPRIVKLLQMVADFNYENNPQYKEKLDKMDISQLAKEVALPSEVAKRVAEAKKEIDSDTASKADVE